MTPQNSLSWGLTGAEPPKTPHSGLRVPHKALLPRECASPAALPLAQRWLSTTTSCFTTEKSGPKPPQERQRPGGGDGLGPARLFLKAPGL